jgi:hypothetical protein
MNLFFWRRRKIAKDLKAVTEVAGDQLSPGVGTFAIVLGGLVVTGVAAYVFHQRKSKKAARLGAASSKSDKSA